VPETLTPMIHVPDVSAEAVLSIWKWQAGFYLPAVMRND
jgi:hypothetical protein